MTNISIESIDSSKIKIISYNVTNNNQLGSFYFENEELKYYENKNTRFYTLTVKFEGEYYTAFLKGNKGKNGFIFEYMDIEDYLNEHYNFFSSNHDFEKSVLEGDVFDKIDFIYILKERILKV